MLTDELECCDVLSALILTAPIHCSASIAEIKKQTHPDPRMSTFPVKFMLGWTIPLMFCSWLFDYNVTWSCFSKTLPKQSAWGLRPCVLWCSSAVRHQGFPHSVLSKLCLCLCHSHGNLQVNCDPVTSLSLSLFTHTPHTTRLPHPLTHLWHCHCQQTVYVRVCVCVCVCVFGV